MAFVLVKDGIVIQKQPDPAEGFIDAPNSVVCGFLFDGEVFVEPPSGKPRPVSPDPLLERIALLETKLARTEKLEAALIDKAVITKADVDVKIVAEPVVKG